MSYRPILGVVLLIASAGCASSYGPKTIPSARFDYNQAISQSWDQQLLLNLVRLRYRDNPLFVDVTSVTAGYTVERSAAIGGNVGSDQANNSTSACSHRSHPGRSKRCRNRGGVSSVCWCAA